MMTKKSLTLASIIEQQGITNETVLKAIIDTPRHVFLPSALTHKAYENTALPIGQGQTISQPYTVAKMTELLLEKIGSDATVLEIGTGSGYQTAILAQIFNLVCSVERIKSLQFQAKRRLNQLDLHNVKMKHGDGWQGWSSKAPFDAIIVTAAASEIPKALIDQLKIKGRLVIPVGSQSQLLKCIDKHGVDKIENSTIASVNFVPLVAGELV